MLKKLTLECEIITPLFMYGADNQTPELRPSEFKGMMRFWWRALKAESDIKRLKEEESKIFGGAGDSTGQKSKVSIRITGYPQKDSNLRDREGLRWQFNPAQQRLVGDHRGIGYLFYSVLSKSYFKPNGNFKIEISSLSDDALKNAIAALWTAIYLGGFGSRARRVGGCVVAKYCQGSTFDINFIPENNESYKLKNWIVKNLDICIKITDRSSQNPTNDYSIISKNAINSILISKNSWGNWKDAVNDIGKIYMDFRASNRNQKLNLAAFGLPIICRSGKVEGVLGRERLSRRASPLILKVIKSGGRFFWCAVRLDGILLPQGAQVIFDNQMKAPNTSLLDTFWNQLKTVAV